MLTIGQMSKVCGVTVKTLHHYDRIGLLRAAKIDRDSGYRYYSDSQIPTMLLIGRLKRYGYSLSDIRRMLEEPEDVLLGELRRQRTRMEWQMNHLSVILREMDRHIDSLERTGDIMSYQNQYTVQVEQAEEQVLLASRQRMSLEEFGTRYSRLYEQIARERLTVTGVTAAVYYDMEFDPGDSDIAVGVGIQEREKATLILPAGLCATTVHVGSYSGLSDAYGAVVRWMEQSGYEMDGAPYELYLKTAFHGLPPEQWETKILFPVKKKA